MNTKILFIHHSTGANIIREGSLRKKLRELNPNLELWDHSYNLYKFFPHLLAYLTHHTGLSDNKGKITGIDYNIVLSNNSPAEYAQIFSRYENDPTLKSILSYDIIAFKNCYPTTKIISDAQLSNYKKYYGKTRDSLSMYPQKKFILITPPPLRKELTQPDCAKRAQQLVARLTSKEFVGARKNLFVFDLFCLLADTQGYLRKEYCRLLPLDSHPNKLANQSIATAFAQYLSKL